jgi:hypothetical protein
MIKTQQALAKFGNPVTDQARFERAWMVVWDIPQEINNAIPCLPNRLYVNSTIVSRLDPIFRELILKGLHREIKTFDGCFNVRKQRGSNSISKHSFGIALDFNAAWNPLVRGVTPATRGKLRAAKVTWSEDFLDVWRNNGWECGADWQTVLDGMHFELKTL